MEHFVKTIQTLKKIARILVYSFIIEAMFLKLYNHNVNIILSLFVQFALIHNTWKTSYFKESKHLVSSIKIYFSFDFEDRTM